MIINSKHTRQALVDILKQLREENALNQRVESYKETDEDMRAYREAGNWLVINQIDMVEQALINNELKDW